MDPFFVRISPPDDSEDLVADLLAQFRHTNGSTTTNTQLEGAQSPTQHMHSPSATPDQDQIPSGAQQVAVEIPALDAIEEYTFLPGHFDVRLILREIRSIEGEASYRVKLRSGETETVSSSRLQTLNHGPEALRHFQDSEQGEHSSGMERSVGGRRLRRRQMLNYNVSSRPNSHMSIQSSGEEDNVSADSQYQARRSRRAKNTRFTEFFDPIGSNDDTGRSAEETYSSDDIIISSAATSRKHRLRRGSWQKEPRRTSRLSDSGSDYARPQGTRILTRERKVLRKNLRERFEDDISEHEESSREKKFFGAKEDFHKVPANDPFRLRHRNMCEACYIQGDDRAKGPLIFCQGCTSSYHQACLRPRATREHLVTKISDDQFLLQCRHCLGLAHTKDPVCPHQGCCAECNGQGKMTEPLRERLTPKQEQQLRQENGGKDPITAVDTASVNNIDNVLFRCGDCHRAFHLEHLPPMADTMEDTATTRFEEYSLDWQCHDCSSAPGEADAIVAWRPADTKSYVSGYTASAMEEVDKEYLIKWKGQSYHHTTWMPGSWVWGLVNHRMRRAFFKSQKNFEPCMTTEEAISEDFLRVDIVFDVQYSEEPHDRNLEADLERVDKVSKAYVKFKGLSYEDVVWESPPDPSHTERWSDFKAAYEDWVRRDYIHTPGPDSLKKHLSHVRKQNFKAKLVRDTQPEIMTGGQIMDHQKDGLNWLYYMWFKQQNAILADEMGLGKTIQVIGLFALLIQYHKCWPFLVVVPNSTCPNWRKEIKTWAPSIRVVTYYGSSFARKLAQDYEMFTEDEPDLRCHVVITSYETMVDDASRRVLSKIPWAGLVVDEGQRLKNDKSQLYGALSKFKFPFKLLLTGTPLQNNMRELFNLLQFCDPTKNAEQLEEEYGTLSSENITELHNMIRPFLLRRTKAQVLTFLPPMVQIIVPVSMSVVQKKLYKSILAKNPQLIRAIFQRDGNSQSLKQAERHNLNNILMQLRKCLCHPFVYSEAIEERTNDIAASHRNLVEAAGKLQLLQLMLPKLHQLGHRVLIFSQFLDNLDLVEDFLDGLGLLHRRLDGRMTSLEKQNRIDEYNAEGSPYFAFLLSTRSGGVGINLATADTVIIMDPDFNPHQDMQALSRAHRIGQKNKVLVFQLMTRGSVEEKIMQIGKKKMVLDHVLIDRMASEEDVGRDLESILRHGAQALFDGDDSGDIHYDSESIDKLLDRSQAEQAKTPDGNASESQLSFARVWANDNQNLDGQLQDSEQEDPTANSTVWEKILQERERAAAEEARRKAEVLGRGKRKRTAVDYANNTAEIASPMKVGREAESDAEFRAEDAVASESESDAEMDAKKTKVHPFQRIKADFDQVPAYPSGAGMDGNMEARHPPCIACNQSHPVGSCRLKMAGVEHCGLCGLAHFGFSRTCPHLKSETQVARMLDALKHSTEDRELIEMAKKYVNGIRRDLAQRKRKRASKAAALGMTAAVAEVVPTRSPVIDLSRSLTPSIGPNRSGQGLLTSAG